MREILRARTHGFISSSRRAKAEERGDLQLVVATAELLDMFRVQKTQFLSLEPLTMVTFINSALTYSKRCCTPAEVDARLWAKWGGSSFDARSCRQACNQQYDAQGC